jgi:glyoxylase-like metal-dependent hydrolase (beta-lactamase superfamily II)
MSEHTGARSAARITLGEVTIDRVIEIPRSSFPTTTMLPDARKDVIASHMDWLEPFYDDDVGDLGSRIGSYVVRTPQTTVLVDTGVGNDKERPDSPLWNRRQGTWLADLAAAGVEPEDVDVVLCTHLHVDHVGWNTRLVDGRWVPTFPSARYLFVGEEYEFWRFEHASGREHYGCIADSVLPIVEAGRATLVESTHAIDDWLRFEPWPGHTPGHACVRLTTGAGEAIFSGDLMHRTVQVAEPQWSSIFCSDPEQARVTRRAFVERHADSGVLLLAAHFPRPGRIVSDRRGFRLIPA